jgi:hypothetical protein
MQGASSLVQHMETSNRPKKFKNAEDSSPVLSKQKSE